MYIIIGENNFITIASQGGILAEGIEVEDFEFSEDIKAYQYVDGKIILNKDKLQHLQKEQTAQKEIEELQAFLRNTDHVALQWLEEDELGVHHHRSKADYKLIMQKRQAARVRIRRLRVGE